MTLALVCKIRSFRYRRRASTQIQSHGIHLRSGGDEGAATV
jgi:hypothetical protein